VDAINIAADRQKFTTLTGKLTAPQPQTSAVPGILVENRPFNLPHLYLARPIGVTPLEFRRDLWHKKTRKIKIALSCGIKMSPVGSLDYWISHKARVSGTDRRADGRTELRLPRPR